MSGAAVDQPVDPFDCSSADWLLTVRGQEAARDPGVAARLTLANGAVGLSGEPLLDGPALHGSVSRRMIAGVFVRDRRAQGAPALATAPDRFARTLRSGGRLLLEAPALDGFSQSLDMRRGLLVTTWRDPQGSLRLRGLQLASQADRNLELAVLALDFDALAEVVLSLRRTAVDSPLRSEAAGPGAELWLDGKAVRFARASEARLEIEGAAAPSPVLAADEIAWTWRAAAGQTAVFTQLTAYAGEGAAVAGERLDGALRRGWRPVLAEHEAAWAERWRCSAIELAGDAAAQRALRFAAYHLNGAANPDDASVSIGARGLTGEDYFGHVFWETEVFLFPFYLLTWPKAARALLMYRHRMLDGARAKARRLGWRGAFFAWESADTGEETAPLHGPGGGRPVDIPVGRDEAHISADVAWATWRYWRATDDDPFLLEAGAEILLETARFWASRVTGGEDGQRHIRSIEGPDEYHQRVDDNAFTNQMARWNILRALDAAAVLGARWPDDWRALAARLGLDAGELARWRRISDDLVGGLDPASGLYEQFAGYYGLRQIDLEPYRDRAEPVDVILGREQIQRSQVIKQADVLQLLATLPELFDQAGALANFAYYAPRCAHGSSLSAPIHALVAARLGLTGAARDYFARGAAVDLGGDAAASKGGVHIGALGGLWQAAVLGFGGVRLGDDGIAIDPHLPAGWTRLAFPLQWRGRRLRVRIEPNLVVVALEAGEPMEIEVAGRSWRLEDRISASVDLAAAAS